MRQPQGWQVATPLPRPLRVRKRRHAGGAAFDGDELRDPTGDFAHGYLPAQRPGATG